MIKVLDVCCGSKLFYFDKNNCNTIYMDIRKEKYEIHGKKVNVDPDIIGDFRDLPFKNEFFHHVIFDPPHLLYPGKNSIMAAQYGSLDKNNWKEDIKKGFEECYRVLKNGGTLIFKWSTHDINVKSILEVLPKKTTLWHSKRQHSLDSFCKRSRIKMRNLKNKPLIKRCPICGKSNFINIRFQEEFKCECGSNYKRIQRKISKEIRMYDMMVIKRDSNIVYL